MRCAVPGFGEDAVAEWWGIMDHKAPDQSVAKTYWRSIKDIDKAVDELRTSIRQQSTLDFLAYFFGCEKLAVAIVGMSQGLDATQAEEKFRRQKPNLDQIKAAVIALRIPFPPGDLPYLFANDDQQKLLDTQISARGLRNKVVHQFGPSNLKALAKYPTIISKMKQFHRCSNHVLDYARNK
jgi:sensor histidine kinase regulating citrate/malate metabolism